MPKKLFAVFLAGMLHILSLHASPEEKPAISFPQGTWFMENRGQVMDQSGKCAAQVLYVIRQPGVSVFLTSSGLTYVFYKNEKEEAHINSDKKEDKYLEKEEEEGLETEYARFDLDLAGASFSKKSIAASEPTPYVYNYYLGGPGCLETGLHGYAKLLISDIYPGIDWALYAGKDGLSLKYDFIIHPGADPSVIQLLYRGREAIELKDSRTLKLRTSLGGLSDHIPLAYAGEEKKNVSVSYRIEKNTKVETGKGWYETTLSFRTEKYDKSKTLVIDPAQLLWGTYFGGAEILRGHILDIDHTGSLVVSGQQNVMSAFPLLNPGNNAYFQGTITGSPGEPFIAKFDSTQALTWCTFFGGSNMDRFNGMAILPNNDVVFCGYTNSNDIVTMNPGGGAYYQPTPSSNVYPDDAMIARFSSAGVLLWSTYVGVGQSGDEELYDVCVDAAGNMYMVGKSSLSSLPVIGPAGSYQQSQQLIDGLIMRFTSAGVLDWCTFLGGSQTEIINNVVLTPAGELVVAGTTQSTNLPVVSPAQLNDYYQPVYGGGTNDGFMARFTPSLALDWCTYFGGSNYEFADANMELDHAGRIVVTGRTLSTNFPLMNPGGSAFFASTGSRFVICFDTSLTLVWSTKLNFASNNVPNTGLAIGPCDEIYVGSYGNAQSASQTYNPGSGAYFFGTDPGGGDMVLLAFDHTFEEIWGTMIGGSAMDDGLVIATDPVGNLYATGDAGGQQYTLANVNTFQTNCLLNPGGGAYYQNLPGMFSDYAFIFKFAPISAPGSVPSASVVFTDPSCPNFNDGTITLSPSGGTPGYTVNWQPINSGDTALTGLSLGNYLYTITDQIGCVLTGAVTLQHTPLYDISVLAGNISLCIGDSTTLIASGAPSVIWSPSVGTGDTIVVSPTTTTTYVATYTDSTGCPNSDSVTIAVALMPQALITGDDTICAGDQVTLTMSGGNVNTWYNFTASNPGVFTFTSDTMIQSISSNGSGCVDTGSFFIRVFPLPNVMIIGQDTVCDSTSISVYTVTPGVILWSTGANSSSINVTQSGLYTVSVTDLNGCVGTASTYITVLNCTGVQELSGHTFSAWPNPATATVFLGLPGHGVWHVEAFDSRGRRVADTQLQGPQAQLSCASWSEGVYTIRFTQEGAVHELQLVKLGSE